MELPQTIPGDSHRFHRFMNEDDLTVPTATTLGLILFISSSYWFKKKYYGVDKNLLNLALFSTASIFSSMGISRFFVESPYTAAARRNNKNEFRHQREIGNI